MGAQKKAIKMPKTVQLPSNLEALFWLQLRAAGIQQHFVQQLKAVPGRQFVFDFACPAARFLVEVQGGNWTHGAHSRPLGLRRDYDKANLAQRHGWRIFQFDTEQVETGAALEWVTEELRQERL